MIRAIHRCGSVEQVPEYTLTGVGGGGRRELLVPWLKCNGVDAMMVPITSVYPQFGLHSDAGRTASPTPTEHAISKGQYIIYVA